jgi:hypothetical protein
MDCELLYQKHVWYFLPAIRTTHHFRASRFATVNPAKTSQSSCRAGWRRSSIYGEYPALRIGDSLGKV